MRTPLVLILTVLMVITTTGCSEAEAKKQITFAAIEDATPATKRLIDTYNASQEVYHVEWVTLPPDARQNFEQLHTLLSEANTKYDVLSLDVTWIGEFAHRGYIEPLDDYMGGEGITIGDYSRGIMEAGRYMEKQYAIPYYQNVGLLYYRKDLIQEMEASVLDSGNYMYSDLAKLSKRYQGEGGTDTGFVFQSGAYEGLTVNVTEFTDSLRSVKKGLETMKTFVDADYTPEDILNYTENQTHDAFIQGKAVFSRNWSYQYQLINSNNSAINLEQVGIAPLPYGGVVGGYLLGINQHTQNKDGAWDFLTFATGIEGQKIMASEGYIPTHSALLIDEEVFQADGILQYESVRNALMTSITRPVSPSYDELSDTIQLSVHKYLLGINDMNTTLYEIDRLVKDYQLITQQTE